VPHKPADYLCAAALVEADSLAAITPLDLSSDDHALAGVL